jgi:tripartite-type tricarboxylate transporter receptor subunit TctC
MQQNIAAGKLKALGTTGRVRSAVLPDVPTVAEAGVPGYEATIWLGLMAPAGTPRAVLVKLNAEVGKIVSRADVKAEWARQGAAPLLMTLDEFNHYLREDIEKWARIVKLSGAKADQ